MNQDTKMICFPSHIVAVFSSVFFHVVEQRLRINTGESEGKNFGDEIEADGDV